MIDEHLLGKKERRRLKILELLASTPLSSIAELAQTLGVSDETIRQDLKSDALKDRIMQAHGSVALRTSTVGTGVPFAFRRSVGTESKARLAERAAKLVEPGSSVMVEHSVVGCMLVEEIIRRPALCDTVTLITNSFPAMSRLIEVQSEMRVIFLGGRFVPGQLNTYGPTTVGQVRSLHADIAFLSPAAVDDELQVTGYIEDDVQFKQAIASRCPRCCLFLERDRLGKTALLDIAHVYDFDTVVTDAELTETQLELLAEHGTRIER